MPSLSIVTAICGSAAITRQWFEETIANCTAGPEVIVVANGCTPDEVGEAGELLEQAQRNLHIVSGRLLVYDEPLGSPKAFNIGAAAAQGEIVAMLHNDLMVHEGGWDQRLWDFFLGRADLGVVGFHGARGVGDPDIYRTPYRLVQLARWDTFSNMEDAEMHGARVTEPRKAAVLDGMALCCRREDYLAWGGMDETLGPHHLYDLDLCLRSLQAGRMNYMLPVRVKHLNGQTANMPRYNEWVKTEGFAAGDADVHRSVHEKFYAKWFGKLPVSV